MVQGQAHDRRAEDGLIKLVIVLDSSDWHGYGAEPVWAEPLSDRDRTARRHTGLRPRVEFRRCRGDGGGERQVPACRFTRPRGHSTYRIFLLGDNGLDSAGFHEHWAPLERLGCSFERATAHLFAVDVPPEADIHRVYELLETGEMARVWDFEEGHCGHSLRPNRPLG